MTLAPSWVARGSLRPPTCALCRTLRHADVRTTTGIYGHLDVEDLRDALAGLPGGDAGQAEPEATPAVEPLPAAALEASEGQRSTRRLPDPASRKREGPGPEGFPLSSRPVPEWAL